MNTEKRDLISVGAIILVLALGMYVIKLEDQKTEIISKIGKVFFENYIK